MAYHNLSTAQTWWKENSHNFEEHGQLFHDIARLLPSALRSVSGHPSRRGSVGRSAHQSAASSGDSNQQPPAHGIDGVGESTSQRSASSAPLWRMLQQSVAKLGAQMQSTWVTLPRRSRKQAGFAPPTDIDSGPHNQV